MDTSRSEHPLFERFPLTGETQLSTGPAPVPYHIYNGHGVFIGGTADATAAAELLRNETVRPMTDTTGRALMGLWVLDLTAASHDPHHEFQVSLLVSRQPARPVKAGALATAEALMTRPEARLFCHGLWNNTPRVVAYNREHLGLNARLTASTIVREANRLRFSAQTPDGASIAQGALRMGRGSLWTTFELMQRLGLSGAQRLAAQPWFEMRVVNPIGLRPANDAAFTASHNGINVLRPFDRRHETLTLADPAYARLDFRPAYVQELESIRFVYLDPAPDA